MNKFSLDSFRELKRRRADTPSSVPNRFHGPIKFLIVAGTVLIGIFFGLKAAIGFVIAVLILMFITNA